MNPREKLFKCVKNIRHYLFEFHTVKKNLYNKPFMKTPCGHVFHSDCLENWLNQKMECPSCRQEIKDFK